MLPDSSHQGNEERHESRHWFSFEYKKFPAITQTSIITSIHLDTHRHTHTGSTVELCQNIPFQYSWPQAPDTPEALVSPTVVQSEEATANCHCLCHPLLAVDWAGELTSPATSSWKELETSLCQLDRKEKWTKRTPPWGKEDESYVTGV